MDRAVRGSVCHSFSFLPSILQFLVSHIIFILHSSLKANHKLALFPMSDIPSVLTELDYLLSRETMQATAPVFPVRVHPVRLCTLSLGKSTPITIKHQRQKACVSFRCLEPCPCHHSEH